MSDHDQLISEFQGISGETTERSRFYLESAAWQLPIALSNFYDNHNVEPENVRVIDDNNDEDDDPMDEDFVPSTNKVQGDDVGAKQTSSTRKKSSKFSSIRDFNDDSKSDDDAEEGQRYYAGGSEHSGELIVGPPRKNKDITKELFNEAKKHGAEPVDSTRLTKTKTSAKYFSGGGYRLGETEETSQFVPAEGKSDDNNPVNIVLKLWSNGFTVDDGQLRDFHDPANQEFLNSIKKGEIPQELLKGSRRGEVHVDMEDHRNDEYKEPKKKVKPFSGQGHMLGSPTPGVTFSQPSTSSSVDPPIACDKSKPTTKLQIRLADGTRLVQEFNHSNTISDIRTFLLTKYPQLQGKEFILMTTFPNKELCDENKSLSDAKLLNASIVQKLK